jgi:hypothetical protein
MLIDEAYRQRSVARVCDGVSDELFGLTAALGFLQLSQTSALVTLHVATRPIERL